MYPTWGWNYGYPWYPAPYYWGGGFWGSMAIGVTSAAVYGAIVCDEEGNCYEEGEQHTHTTETHTVTSYEVLPDSPGAKLLQAYGLTQTKCGGKDLVVIWGPEDSVICASPNATVPAGTYGLDSQTLTLSQQPAGGQQQQQQAAPVQPQSQPQAQPSPKPSSKPA
jgi:hypothetical protein